MYTAQFTLLYQLYELVAISCILQTTDIPADLGSLKQSLADQNIIVNVFSTYRKLSSKAVIGIDWEEKVISRKNNLQETKNLPQVNWIIYLAQVKLT